MRQEGQRESTLFLRRGFTRKMRTEEEMTPLREGTRKKPQSAWKSTVKFIEKQNPRVG